MTTTEKITPELLTRYKRFREDGYKAETAMRYARNDLRYAQDRARWAALGLRRYAAWSIYKGAYCHSWSVYPEHHGIPDVSEIASPLRYVSDDLRPFRRCLMVGHRLPLGKESEEVWFWVSVRGGKLVVTPAEAPRQSGT
jgi:hypothetical protein